MADRPLAEYYGTHWQHLKTDHVYEIIGSCRIEASNTPAFLYRLADQDDATISWARPVDEFLDGRFKRLPFWFEGLPVWSEMQRNRCISGKPPKGIKDNQRVRIKGPDGQLTVGKAIEQNWLYVDEYQYELPVSHA